jgi:hypothetical protein
MLRWLGQESPRYFEQAFNAAYDKLNGSVTLEQAKKIIQKYIGKEELSDNPFIQELRAFLDEAERMVLAK